MVEDLEDRVRAVETNQVRLETDLKHIASELHRLNTGINRLMWTLASGFLGALVLWVVNGGLAR